MDDRFRFIESSIEDLIIFECLPISDQRGYLERLFCADTFHAHNLTKPIVQVNRTLTNISGTVRGLHFQNPPYTETKIVICLEGTVMDVAVDIRRNSDTFLNWHSEILSETNNKGILIPDGFAHGFQALTNNCELLYLHTSSYQLSSEGGINAKDLTISIDWLLPVTNISERDQALPFIDDSFSGLVI